MPTTSDQLRQNVADAIRETEAAHPELKNDVAFTRMGTWDKNENGCGCHACNPRAAWFVVCDVCGCKRCPHATAHELDCSGSNLSGQKGSRWK